MVDAQTGEYALDEEQFDEVGVTSQALTQTLFSEGFESGTLSAWTATSGAVTNSSATGYANHSGARGGRFNGAGWLRKDLNTTGYTNITVNYWRNGYSIESGDRLTAEWSNNGTSWTAMESVAPAMSWTSKTFVLPAGAAGQANLRVRFNATVLDSGDGAYVDDITVTGDSAAAPACGDAVCNGTETCSTCQGDCGACGPSCGDLTCNGTETCSTCPGDCGACPSTSNPQVAGPYAACYYSANVSKPQFASPRLYYPCAPGTAPSGAIASGTFAASTLTPGYTNSSSVIFWLADHAATHGFIVLAVQPDSTTLGNNPNWRDAHKDAYAEILEENARAGSPIQGHVNTNKIQIMGFSKGGGGALMAGNELTSEGKVVGAVQALAPYCDSSCPRNLITAPTAIHAGSSDTTASVSSHAQPMYNGLSTSTKRMLGVYSGLTHGDWYSGSGSIRYKMKQYITSWMKVHLDGNTAYQTYLNGANHQASWFTSFTIVP